MDLIIVRHARPVRVELAEGEGSADPELSEIGWEQAKAVGDFLAGEHVDHIAASSMLRAHQTAQPLAEKLGLEIELRDDLQESDVHSSSYVPAEEMTPESEIVQRFMNDPLSMFDEGYEVFRDRVVGGFDELINTHGGKRVVAFCHGMVTAVYLQVLLGLDSPFDAARPDYTGITRVQASSKGHRTIRSINESGHVRNLIERAWFS